MGHLGGLHIERLVYLCECRKGKTPHIHWDFYRGEPEQLVHPEPWPEQEADPEDVRVALRDEAKK